MNPDRQGRIRPSSLLAGPNEIEVCMMVICALIAILYLFVPLREGSVESRFPPAVVFLWFSSLGFGSGLTLWGGMRRRATVDKALLRGLGLYRAGWIYLGSASLFYGLAIMGAFHTSAIDVASGLTTLGWGLACCLRAARVSRIMRYAVRDSGAADD